MAGIFSKCGPHRLRQGSRRLSCTVPEALDTRARCEARCDIRSERSCSPRSPPGFHCEVAKAAPILEPKPPGRPRAPGRVELRVRAEVAPSGRTLADKLVRILLWSSLFYHSFFPVVAIKTVCLVHAEGQLRDFGLRIHYARKAYDSSCVTFTFRCRFFHDGRGK